MCQPAPVALEDGAVEPVMADELLAILFRDGAGLVPSTSSRGTTFTAFHGTHGAETFLDGTAWDDMDQGKTNQRDADEGRDGEKEAMEDIAGKAHGEWRVENGDLRIIVQNAEIGKGF